MSTWDFIDSDTSLPLQRKTGGFFEENLPRKGGSQSHSRNPRKSNFLSAQHSMKRVK